MATVHRPVWLPRYRTRRFRRHFPSLGGMTQLDRLGEFASIKSRLACALHKEPVADRPKVWDGFRPWGGWVRGQRVFNVNNYKTVFSSACNRGQIATCIACTMGVGANTLKPMITMAIERPIATSMPEPPQPFSSQTLRPTTATTMTASRSKAQ